ncbi:uncharacterized protein LOC113223082 [Piliocolobus tephrosceles]|uniref:uncharacterized protein LOC113223081 n=1 Tax=Piliocolobus tephrosceles TaxID=591936 RepID=UPI000E6B08B1|nr:uncharacterized protein LOC113223081 [Piliocolobus tephrosceles]XP_026308449.1 uncharacterized protein LOC113223082 [Piliocolobus tephrosceles]
MLKMRRKARMADFFPFWDRALHKDGAGMGPRPTAPVTFPSPLSARGAGAAGWGAVGAAPPVASAYVMPGPWSPCAQAPKSVCRALPKPAAQPPQAQRPRRETPVAAPGPAPQPAPQRPWEVLWR